MSPRARIGLEGRNPQAYPRLGVLLWHSRASIAAGPAPCRGGLAVPRYIGCMCGRATCKLTWEEIVALHRLTLGQPAGA